MAWSSSSACLLCGNPLRQRYAFGEYAVAYCAACQLGQLVPRPTAEALATLYASQAYFEGNDSVGYASYSRDAPQLMRTFRAKLKRLRRTGPVHSLLEIGCSTGYFLQEARRMGIERLVGIDCNPWAVAEAQRQGLDVREGSIDILAAEPRFDAVVMLDVLEHITDPLPFLRAVRARLRPDGRLLIMTPNIRSLLARVSGPRWVSFKIPEHAVFYSPRSIRLLLSRCGFEVVMLRGTGQYVTIAFLLNRLRRIAPTTAAVLQRAARRLHVESSVVFVTNGSIDVVARTSALTETVDDASLVTVSALESTA